MTIAATIRLVQQSLSPDLLKGQWRTKQGYPLQGHCYTASEALWHLIGGKGSGYIPHILTHAVWPEGLQEGETHWFLRKDKTILDPTVQQFAIAPNYEGSRACGFLTKLPSRRARIVIDRVNSSESFLQSVEDEDKSSGLCC